MELRISDLSISCAGKDLTKNLGASKIVCSNWHNQSIWETVGHRANELVKSESIEDLTLESGLNLLARYFTL